MTRTRKGTLGGRLVVVAVLGIASLAGCETIVGSALPDFTCTGSDPSSCPAGSTCDPASLRCVPEGLPTDDSGDGPVEAAPDAPAPDARDSTPPDAPKDTNPGPLPLGAICRVDGDCQSHICGDQSVLTPQIVATTGPVCTAPCCRSEDCPAGSVCFATGTGGSYCVTATQAGRTQTGASQGGETCATGTSCRSGLCATKCVDTCCTLNDCTNGTTCRITTVATHLGFACADPPPGQMHVAGQSCTLTGDSDCTTNLCYSTLCRLRSCGSASCTAQGLSGDHGRVGTAGSDSIAFCIYGTTGSLTGQTCVNSSDCKSEFCDPVEKVCAELCCVDADCTTVDPTFVCRPAPVSPRYLRCVPQ